MWSGDRRKQIREGEPPAFPVGGKYLGGMMTPVVTLESDDHSGGMRAKGCLDGVKREWSGKWSSGL